MLVTCPSCSMRYLIADEAIGEKGRRVRCKHCGHEWFQEPFMAGRPALQGEADLDLGFLHGMEEDEKQPQDFQSVLRKEASAGAVPPGVRPAQENDDDPIRAQLGRKSKLPVSRDRLAGTATAVGIYAVLFAVILALHGPLGRTFPSLNMLYGAFGLVPPPPGAGLVLDELKAQTEGGVLTLSGKIINLRSEETPIPSIMATISGKGEGKPLSRLFILPPRHVAAAEEEIPFSMKAPPLPLGAASVSFAFSVLTPPEAPEQSGHPQETQSEDKHAVPPAGPRSEEGHAPQGHGSDTGHES